MNRKVNINIFRVIPSGSEMFDRIFLCANFETLELYLSVLYDFFIELFIHCFVCFLSVCLVRSHSIYIIYSTWPCRLIALVGRRLTKKSQQKRGKNKLYEYLIL